MLAAHMRRSRLMALMVTWLTVSLLAYAQAPNTVTVVLCAAALGAGTSAFFVTTSSIIQRDAPPASRGRIMSLNQASMGVSYGIGLMVVGSIGDLSNLRIAFTVAALVMAGAFLLARSRSNTWYPAIDGTPTEPTDRLVAA
jgi:MFS family permease